jgi:protein tyrosine phosphatase (PTP) superfamily phosphohydrolase (DUF442 family)
MSHIKRSNKDFTVAGQASAEEIERASQIGFRSILNVRSPHETGFVNEESRLTESVGL